MCANTKISPETYHELLDNERQLTEYLYYIRHKRSLPKITVDTSILQDKIESRQTKLQIVKQNSEVSLYVHIYIKLLRQVMCLENYATKKIFKKVLQFLEEFPTMNFLYEVINSFGKNQKKLSLNETMIMLQATDEMIPLFQKIIEKIQSLKKQFESKKLLELGHRIQHLQDLVKDSKGIIAGDPELRKVFKTYEVDRVEKYLLMEENIVKAEKKFGDFSPNFIKNREIFSNLNQVYLQIKNHDR